MLLQILPAVVRFRPDMIFISAGFDAHRKDDLNYRYIGIAEKEYEWVTDQIVQVANRCGGVSSTCSWLADLVA
jgi:acetoin utilization deacetylase AcuC-like enzyme